MTTMIHGVNLRLEMVMPPTSGFVLDVDKLDVGTFGPDTGWQDVTCDVSDFAIQRGDTFTDQRPNSALELGTLSITVLDRLGVLIPDDLARLLGETPTNMRPGQAVRLLANNPVDAKWFALFIGKVIDYDSEWVAGEEGGRLVTIVAADSVADIAAINPMAQPAAIRDKDLDSARFTYLATLLAGLSATFWKGSDPFSISFRAETFAEPMAEQLQRWADTALAHLAMRHSDAVTGTNVPTPWLFAVRAGQQARWLYKMQDCLLGPPAGVQDIPLHWAHLSVKADAIVNDCLASSDNTAERRYLATFRPYGGSGTYTQGLMTAVSSDNGTTWGISLGDLDRLGVNHGPQWTALPLNSTLEMYFEGADYERTGKVFRWNVQGPTSVQGSGHWLSGLHADIAIDYPPGQYLVSFAQASDIIPDGATASRAIDAVSQELHGLQDYRRLDLRLYLDTDAAKWAAQVVKIAANTTTYLDQAEVHIDADAKSVRGIQVDLLDRLQIAKQFPAHDDQVLVFTGDVVGIVDECDTNGWTRRFYLYPISAVPAADMLEGAA